MAKAKVDARSNFNTQQLDTIQKLVDITEEIKRLETQKQQLSDSVKTMMQKVKIESIDFDGKVLSLTESQRRTVHKKTKEEFITTLLSLGKKHLIHYEIEPDLDSIFAEVDTGKLDKDMVKKYVTVTPVVTLRCL